MSINHHDLQTDQSKIAVLSIKRNERNLIPNPRY